MTLKSGFLQAWLGLAAVPAVGRAQGRDVLAGLVWERWPGPCWILKLGGYFKPS